MAARADSDKADAMAAGLNRLLRPKSVAVMGGDWARSVVLELLDTGFGGDIWPVRPRGTEFEGLKAYNDLASLPAAPDAVFIGINRLATIEAVAELAAMGAGGAVAFASGFAEVEDGQDLQNRLLEAAGGMPVLGPNCYGLINYLDGSLLWPDVHGGRRVERGVAIVTQSSNLAINLTMDRGGLPIAYVATLGNQAMVGMADMVRAVAADDRVTAIGLHIEGISDVGDFFEAAVESKESGKPVVALKAGASESARRTALSHTASLAGSHQVATSFFKAAGIGQVEGIEAFLQALGLLHCFGAISESSLLSMSCSGGEAALVADAAHACGIPMPDFDAAARAAIAETVNPLVAVANPFDYHTFDWGDRERLTATFTRALAAGMGVNALVLDFPAQHVIRTEGWHTAIDALRAARDATGAKAAVLASMPENMPAETASQLMEDGIAPLRGLHNAMEALKAAHAASLPPYLDRAPAGRGALPDKIVTLVEVEAKAVLAEAGIAIPAGCVVDSLVAALEAAKGRVVAMKAGAAHKTEEGGVRLGLDTPEKVEAAWRDLSGRGRVLVEEMSEGGVAEMILGVARDACYGLHLVVGAGGVETEILQDAAVIMLPAPRSVVEEAIRGLRMAPLLEGFRGRPVADMEALFELVDRVQDYAVAHGDSLVELDINPVLVREDGVVALDALIRQAQ